MVLVLKHIFLKVFRMGNIVHIYHTYDILLTILYILYNKVLNSTALEHCEFIIYYSRKFATKTYRFLSYATIRSGDYGSTPGIFLKVRWSSLDVYQAWYVLLPKRFQTT